MTKKEFIELTGENPEDVLGGDWQNIADEWNEKPTHGAGSGCPIEFCKNCEAIDNQ